MQIDIETKLVGLDIVLANHIIGIDEIGGTLGCRYAFLRRIRLIVGVLSH